VSERDEDRDQHEDGAERSTDQTGQPEPAGAEDTLVDAPATDAPAAEEAAEEAADGSAAGTVDARPEKRPDRGLTRRTWTLGLSLLLVLALGLIGGLVKVPYVALGPGPSFDTLSAVDGTPVISVQGVKSYPTQGQLRMVTVSLTDDMTLFGALGYWIGGGHALAPRDEYYAPGQSEQQVEQQNVQEFKDSQSDAEVSALRYLHYPIDVVAQEVVDNSPADKVIRPGDRLVRVNGKSVSSAEDVVTAVSTTKPGQTIQLVVQTPGQAQRTVSITLASAPDRTQGFMGLTSAAHADVNFKVNISLANIGGPSAGLMFALAIVDKLTGDDVNGGMAVAGTGEIDDQGDVEPIGGIPFKLVAARDAGATIFLTPAANCAEAKAHVPDGLRLVKVTSLGSAVSELADLKAGRPVPGC
jgi:PDZ domain-containing protein